MAVIMSQGWDLGCWGSKTLAICDGAPSTARSSNTFAMKIKEIHGNVPIFDM